MFGFVSLFLDMPRILPSAFSPQAPLISMAQGLCESTSFPYLIWTSH